MQPKSAKNQGLFDEIELAEYSLDFLERSWVWFRDPELRKLTMTPAFDRHAQTRFFESIPLRKDYRIWGVQLLNGQPIGAAGLKSIRADGAEYWGYIGEKVHWGRGLGKSMLAAVEDRARTLGLSSLYLNVARENARALSVYTSAGYAAQDAASEPILMSKNL